MSRLKRDISERKVRKIIRRTRVRELTGASDPSFWRWERAGTFPKRIRLTESGAVGWYEDEILEWIHSRIRAVGKRPPGVAPAAPRPQG